MYRRELGLVSLSVSLAQTHDSLLRRQSVLRRHTPLSCADRQRQTDRQTPLAQTHTSRHTALYIYIELYIPQDTHLYIYILRRHTPLHCADRHLKTHSSACLPVCLFVCIYLFLYSWLKEKILLEVQGSWY